jgi:hypothetical protein
MQGCSCSVGGGEHKFKPMMVESVPPDVNAMSSVGINDVAITDDGFDADDRCKLILALTTRRYAIICEACGASAGGFKVTQEDPDSEQA